MKYMSRPAPLSPKRIWTMGLRVRLLDNGATVDRSDDLGGAGVPWWPER